MIKISEGNHLIVKRACICHHILYILRHFGPKSKDITGSCWKVERHFIFLSIYLRESEFLYLRSSEATESHFFHLSLASHTRKLTFPLHCSTNDGKWCVNFSVSSPLSGINLSRMFSALPSWLSGKESTYQCRKMWVWSLGREDPLEKEMETHSNILARKIPWTEEPSRLQSMGSQRVRHIWATSLHFTSWPTSWSHFSLTSKFSQLTLLLVNIRRGDFCWVRSERLEGEHENWIKYT